MSPLPARSKKSLNESPIGEHNWAKRTSEALLLDYPVSANYRVPSIAVYRDLAYNCREMADKDKCMPAASSLSPRLA